jgi:Mg/Co/Ni transporter MgtE
VNAARAKESERQMTDEEADKIIALLLKDRDAGLGVFRQLSVEQRKQVIERAQDERIDQIVAEADAESITD